MLNSSKNVLPIFALTILGALFVAFSYAIVIDGNVDVGIIMLPTVVKIASIIGVAVGILFYPLILWGLAGTKLVKTGPMLFVGVAIVTTIITLIKPELGFRSVFVTMPLGIIAIRYLSGRNRASGSGMNGT